MILFLDHVALRPNANIRWKFKCMQTIISISMSIAWRTRDFILSVLHITYYAYTTVVLTGKNMHIISKCQKHKIQKSLLYDTHIMI